MANVFDKIGDIKNNIRRNNFDWSHDNNFTTGFGRIIPVFCTQVPAGSSLRINPTFGLQFMPMMFPVQTKVKAYLSAYRMPLRALWKDYKDWVSSANDQTSQLEPPYMEFKPEFGKKQILGVSGLSDYLGLPVTASLESASIEDSNLGQIYDPLASDIREALSLPNPAGGSYTTPAYLPTNEPYANWNAVIAAGVGAHYYRLANWTTGKLVLPAGSNQGSIRLIYTFSVGNTQGARIVADIDNIQNNKTSNPGGADATVFCIVGFNPNKSTSNVAFRCDIKRSGITYVVGEDNRYYFTCFGETNVTTVGNATNNGAISVQLYVPNTVAFGSGNSQSTATFISDDKVINFTDANSLSMDLSTCPYYLNGQDNTNALKISAYPYRTYEAIYNAYIRNNKNNPFLIDGKPTYNKWIPTDDGGADTTDYVMRSANWASDMFTTAVPSPQQGQAPLVGITTYESTMTLENGHTETTINTALVDEDGNKYKVNYESNGEELKNVSYTKLSSDTPVKPLSSLYDLVTSGISINDFRNVNAYQRYLELNMFRGYSYKDIVEGRFDVNIRYDDLNMPEYLGGCTRDVTISPITQVVQTNSAGTYDGSLGSQAGLGFLRGDCENISCYCDEESIIMVLLHVVPMPVYTQTLPKYFLYRERLDSFNPEFDNIGFQPIRLSEIAPIQQWIKDPTKMNDVFGYQRPWYEYCQQLDTAHGLFKTDLRNFLINRVFGSVPELGAEFTTVDEDEVNDVFAVTDVSDKILGQIHFDITAKLPISRVVVPKLE